MYFAIVLLLLLILPAASILIEAAHSHATLLFLIGRWFVFWAVGIRLFIARHPPGHPTQIHRRRNFRHPRTRGLPHRKREVGFANLSMGLLGTCTLFHTAWIVPAAIVGGLYYGLAGAGHIFQKNKNAKEYTAMISDEFVFVILLIFILDSLPPACQHHATFPTPTRYT